MLWEESGGILHDSGRTPWVIADDSGRDKSRSADP